ncbi:MAG: hypothetical protein LBS31_12355 [Candidatus Adiutrix sp.]|jgi:hypothetical protein|nr:hypothetical protein [Candidatus Adiutrix sp.]
MKCALAEELIGGGALFRITKTYFTIRYDPHYTSFAPSRQPMKRKKRPPGALFSLFRTCFLFVSSATGGRQTARLEGWKKIKTKI